MINRLHILALVTVFVGGSACATDPEDYGDTNDVGLDTDTFTLSLSAEGFEVMVGCPDGGFTAVPDGLWVSCEGSVVTLDYWDYEFPDSFDAVLDDGPAQLVMPDYSYDMLCQTYCNSAVVEL